MAAPPVQSGSIASSRMPAFLVGRMLCIPPVIQSVRAGQPAHDLPVVGKRLPSGFSIAGCLMAEILHPLGFPGKEAPLSRAG